MSIIRTETTSVWPTYVTDAVNTIDGPVGMAPNWLTVQPRDAGPRLNGNDVMARIYADMRRIKMAFGRDYVKTIAVSPEIMELMKGSHSGAFHEGTENVSTLFGIRLVEDSVMTEPYQLAVSLA